MSCTILFEGSFLLDKPLVQNHRLYLQRFSQTRRVKWFVEELEGIPDPIRVNVGLPLGPDGAYFLGREPRVVEQGNDPLIKNENTSPQGQPGLWCDWIFSDDGERIVHAGGDKFPSAQEWLYYLIHHFLQPWGYKLSGEVDWEISERMQSGTIIVEENVIQGFDVALFERRLTLLEQTYSYFPDVSL